MVYGKTSIISLNADVQVVVLREKKIVFFFCIFAFVKLDLFS